MYLGSIYLVVEEYCGNKKFYFWSDESLAELVYREACEDIAGTQGKVSLYEISESWLIETLLKEGVDKFLIREHIDR